MTHSPDRRLPAGMALGLALLAVGCASVQSATLPLIAALSPSVDSMVIVNAPPSGARFEAEAAFVRGPWGEARLAQARADDTFDAFSAFAPVLGESFSAETYPLTSAALGRLLAPLGAAIGVAKNRYHRERPFEADGAVTPCIEPTDRLRASGAYPSGHAAFGWAWGLVLAELAPTRADAILTRARDYGDSRVVCGVHYPSDVESGRLIAAAALARLHAEPGFRAALDSARAEHQ